MAIDSAKQRTDGITILSGGLLDITAGRLLIRTQVKVADYQVLESDSGTIFTNYGDDAHINFTLPTNPKAGLFYIFVNAADYNLTVTGGVSGELITHDSVAGVSVDFDQASNKKGQAVLAFADGNKWYALQLTAGTFGVNE